MMRPRLEPGLDREAVSGGVFFLLLGGLLLGQETQLWAVPVSVLWPLLIVFAGVGLVVGGLLGGRGPLPRR